jgi:hypothetical protein
MYDDNELPVHDELRELALAYIRTQMDNSPLYATFACKHYRDWMENGDGETDPGNGIEDACSCDFVGDLPMFGQDLPACPICAGPSVLLGVLVPAEH